MNMAAPFNIPAAECCARCAALELRIATLETALCGCAWGTEKGAPHTAAEEIRADICILFQISIRDLLEGPRTPHLSQARFALEWVIRQELNWSTGRIARFMKLKDHSTIVSGLRRAQAFREGDGPFRALTDCAVTNSRARRISATDKGE